MLDNQCLSYSMAIAKRSSWFFDILSSIPCRGKDPARLLCITGGAHLWVVARWMVYLKQYSDDSEPSKVECLIKINTLSMNDKKVCPCPHHAMLPIFVVAFGLTFLLRGLGVLEPSTASVIWPVIVMVAGVTKFGSRFCTCCWCGRGVSAGSIIEKYIFCIARSSLRRFFQNHLWVYI